MIYHFISGKHIHLSPQIIDSVLSNANFTNLNGKDDIFIYIENTGKQIFQNRDTINVYNDIAQKYGFLNLKFINNSWNLFWKILRIKVKDKVIFHSALNPKILVLINFFIYIFNAKNKAKSFNYICWGSDFGYNRKINKCDNMLKRFVAHIYEKVWPWYGHIVTLTSGDQKLLSDAYNSDNISVIPYIGDKMFYTSIVKEQSPIRIMVSHSGWEHNKHIESFNMLKRFKDEDILIVCPLCYGDSQYIQDVIQQGIKIFGSKFFYFTELKTSDEYLNLLLKNHIYVTGAEIQTGLGALYRNMRGNAKIYVRANLYQSCKSDGYIVYNYDEIGHLSFKEFINPNSNDIFLHNINTYNHIKIDSVIEKWKKLYS